MGPGVNRKGKVAKEQEIKKELDINKLSYDFIGNREYNQKVYDYFNTASWDDHLNDVEALEEAEKNTTGSVQSHIRYRIKVLNEFNKRENIAKNSENVSKIVKNVDSLDSYEDDNARRYKNVHMIQGISYKHQNRNQSCWSEALSGMLSSRGLEVPSEMLRAYKTDIATSFKDEPKSVYDQAQLVHKLLPNTGMRMRKVKPVLNKNELINNLKDMVNTGLIANKSPIAITNGKHYLTIVGTGTSVRNNQEGIFYLDSALSDPKPTFISYSYFIDSVISMRKDITDQRQDSLVECAWLEDYTVELDANNQKVCKNLAGNSLVRYNPDNDKIEKVVNPVNNKSAYAKSFEDNAEINKVTYTKADSTGRVSYVDEIAIPLSLNTKGLAKQMVNSNQPVNNNQVANTSNEKVKENVNKDINEEVNIEVGNIVNEMLDQIEKTEAENEAAKKNEEDVIKDFVGDVFKGASEKAANDETRVYTTRAEEKDLANEEKKAKEAKVTNDFLDDVFADASKKAANDETRVYSTRAEEKEAKEAAKEVAKEANENTPKVDYKGYEYNNFIKSIDSNISGNVFFEGYDFDLTRDFDLDKDSGNKFYDSFKNKSFGKNIQYAIRELSDVKIVSDRYKEAIKSGADVDFESVDKVLTEKLNNTNDAIKKYITTAPVRTTENYIKALSLSTALDNTLARRNIANDSTKENYDNVIKEASKSMLPNYQQIYRLRHKVSDTLTILNRKNSKEFEEAFKNLRDVIDFVMPEFHDKSVSGKRDVNKDLMSDDSYKRKLLKLKESCEAYVRHATVDSKGYLKTPSTSVGKERLLAFSQIIKYTDDTLKLINNRERVEMLPVNVEAATKAIEEKELTAAVDKARENGAIIRKYQSEEIKRDPLSVGHKKVFDINSQTYKKPEESNIEKKSVEKTANSSVLTARAAIRFLKNRWVDVKFGFKIGWYDAKEGIKNIFTSKKVTQTYEPYTKYAPSAPDINKKRELTKGDLSEIKEVDEVFEEDYDNDLDDDFEINFGQEESSEADNANDVKNSDSKENDQEKAAKAEAISEKEKEENHSQISEIDESLEESLGEDSIGENSDKGDLDKSFELIADKDDDLNKSFEIVDDKEDDNELKIVDSKDDNQSAANGDEKKEENRVKRFFVTAGTKTMAGINYLGKGLGTGLKKLGDTKFGQKCKKGFGYAGGQLIRLKNAFVEKYDEVFLNDMEATNYANSREEMYIGLTDEKRYLSLKQIRDNITGKKNSLIKNQNLMKLVARNVEIRANKDRIREQLNNKEGAGLGSVELKEVSEDGKVIDKEKVGAGFTQNVGATNLGRAAVLDENVNNKKIGFKGLVEAENAENEKKINLQNNLAKNKKLIDELEGKNEKVAECTLKALVEVGRQISDYNLSSGVSQKFAGTLLNLVNSYNKAVNKVDYKPIEKLPIKFMDFGFEKIGADNIKWSSFSKQILDCVDAFDKLTEGDLKAMDIYQASDSATRAYITLHDTLYPEDKLELLSKSIVCFDCLRLAVKAGKKMYDDKQVINNIRDFQNSEKGMKLMEKKSEDWNFTRMIKDSTESRIQGLKREMIQSGMDIGFQTCLGVSTAIAPLKAASYVVDRTGLTVNFSKSVVDYIKKNYWDDKAVYYNDIFGGKENYDKICEEMNIKPSDLDREVLKATKMTSINELADYVRAEHAMQLASNNNAELSLNTIDYMKKAGYDKPQNVEAVNKALGGTPKLKNLVKKERDIAGYGMC